MTRQVALWSVLWVGMTISTASYAITPTDPTNLTIKRVDHPVVVLGKVLSSRVIKPTANDTWFPYALLTIDVIEVLVGDVADTIQAATLDCVFEDKNGLPGWITAGTPICFPGESGLFIMSDRRRETPSHPPKDHTSLEMVQFILLRDPTKSGRPFDNGVMIDRRITLGNSATQGNPEQNPRAFYKITETKAVNVTIDSLRSVVRGIYD